MPKPQRGTSRATPPPEIYDEAAERAVLAAIFADNTAMRFIPELRPHHFFRPLHRAIFVAMVGLDSAGTVIDPVTVLAQMRTTGESARSIDDTLVDLTGVIHGGSRAIAAHASIVRDNALRRDCAQFGSKMHEISLRPTTTREMLIEEISAFLERATTEVQGVPPAQHITEAVDVAFREAITTLRGGEPPRAPTTLIKLDDYISGVTYGETALFVGRPGSGKSLVKARIARGNGEMGNKVLVVNTEDPLRTDGTRHAAVFANANINTLRNPQKFVGGNDPLTIEELEASAELALARARDLPIYILSVAYKPFEDIEMAMDYAQLRHGPFRAVMLDHSHAIPNRGRYAHAMKHEFIATIGKQWVAWLRRHDCAGFLFAQPRGDAVRQRGKGADDRLHADDIRDGTSLYEDARVAIAIDRPYDRMSKKARDAMSPQQRRVESTRIDLYVDKFTHGPQLAPVSFYINRRTTNLEETGDLSF